MLTKDKRMALAQAEALAYMICVTLSLIHISEPTRP